MDKLSLILIGLYQKYLSPRKGYCCAYGSLYKNGSCSQQVSMIIQEQGLIRGWPKIKNQFVLCSEAYETIKESDESKVKKKKKKDSWYDMCDVTDVFSCIPLPTRLCKGKSTDVDGDCDLPCDCSP